MRELVLGGVIAALIGYGTLHPWVGILGWTWISTMNPHAYAWRLSAMPVAAGMALAVLIGTLVTRDRRQFFLTRESGTLLVFMIWMCITLPFSFYFDESYSLWNRVMKIDLMVMVALIVLHTKKQILALAWVLVASIGFFGVKGGLFTLATGGSYRVWGPANSYISGNNEIALALVMTIPLMEFLRQTVRSVWVKWGLLLSMLLCAVAALGSQSRGAFLAIAAMGAVLWFRSDKKLSATILILTLAIFTLIFMPEQWWARMGTITEYTEDASAGGRINAWWMAWNLAKANFFGGGFMVSMPKLFAMYAPDPSDIHAAHSIYFMVLGEHGFVGLFLFLLMWCFVWSSAGQLRIDGLMFPQTQWLASLGAMCQVSLAGYAVGGAFLSLAYYDLPYNILVLVVLGKRWIQRQELSRESAESEPKYLPKTVTKSNRKLT